MRKNYATDLTDAEWKILEPLVPEAEWYPNLQEPKYPRREMVNAIFYRQRTGCQWRNLPHDFPPWKQVYECYRKWRDNGLVKAIHDSLRDSVREQTPHADGTARDVSATVCILDSQSVKTSEEGARVCGYDAGKNVKGRKRHIVVDMLGFILAISVTGADIQDREAAPNVLRRAKAEHPALELAIMDGGYRGKLETTIKESIGMRTEIRLRTDTEKKGSSPLRSDGLSSVPSVG